MPRHREYQKTSPCFPKDYEDIVRHIMTEANFFTPSQPARVHLIAFNTGIVSQKEIILADRESLRKASGWVDSLGQLAKGNGQTHLWTTLHRGLQIAAAYSSQNPSQPVTVRVLTDGKDNEGVTSLEKMLAEFPQVDGEHIRGNLILLGDFELKTKLSLPEGAFVVSPNAKWTDIFPPVVLVFPPEPTAGDEARFVENTRAVYASYQWLIDDKFVGNDKALSWRFPDARGYRVTLRVKGLQGAANSSTVVVSVKGKDAFTAEVVSAEGSAQPGDPVKFVARTSLPAKRFNWSVNGAPVGTQPDLTWNSKHEGEFQIALAAWSEDGRLATNSRVLAVKEAPVAARITSPDEVIAGQVVQFAADVTGPCARIEWQFGDGSASQEKDPKHSFAVDGTAAKEFQVSLKATSPAGHSAEAATHVMRVQPATNAKPPTAGFRILEQTFRVGDKLHFVDESQGYLESWLWQVTGENAVREKNPVIQMTTGGKKTIALWVHGPGGDSRFRRISLWGHGSNQSISP
jgi:hypothetical protein